MMQVKYIFASSRPKYRTLRLRVTLNSKIKNMKKITLLLSILFVTLFSFAGNPPEAIQKAFKAKFPDAANVKWGKENKTEWEAEFTVNGTKTSANFSIDGTWVETETQIKTSELPKAVAAAINKQYPDWITTEADKIENVKKGTFYEADIRSGNKKKEVVLKEDGTFIK